MTETKALTAREVILAVMQDVQGVAKKDKNTSQGFNFRGIDAVVNKVGPALRAAGGFIVPNVLDRATDVIASKSGGALNVVRLTVEFAVYGATGDPITGTVVSEAMDSGDKSTAKAMSVAFRTFLLQTLALPTDEPDPDHDSYEIAPAVAAPLPPLKPVTPPSRAWNTEVELLASIEDARALYNAAQRAKAGQQVLDAIQSKAESLGNG